VRLVSQARYRRLFEKLRNLTHEQWVDCSDPAYLKNHE